ncbi:hypothetical protein [Salinimonas chungwhensis]|uniref:hypothetical protein n=1 Tax=Salinimonas chungwhensis TaxID=265425 RepID=UPI00036CFC2C|nr:hypothetical protein [Salinimonas chungwhensis]
MAFSKHAISGTFIWLGVGHTADLSCISEETQLVLVDANPSALKKLEKQYSTKGSKKGNHIFTSVCLAPQAGEAEFYHYNLSEYSALSELTGLRQLFPGIKLKATQTLTTIAVADFIRSQPLSTQNNTLRIDIIDQCLPFLCALAQDGMLELFNYLELQTSTESLYQNAATTSDIVQFLSKQGYELRSQDNSDPDLPTLGFTLNPLWQTLQSVQQQLVEEKKNSEQTQAHQAKVLAEKETKLIEVNKQRDEQKAAKEKQTVRLKELQTQYKTLLTQNRHLQTQTKDNAAQLEQLKAELLKAEAQITLIRDLFFKNDTFQGSEGQ